MSVEYKIQLKFTGDDDVKRSLTIGNANSGATKEQVLDFADSYYEIYTDVTTCTTAELVQTTRTDLLID